MKGRAATTKIFHRRKERIKDWGDVHRLKSGVGVEFGDRGENQGATKQGGTAVIETVERQFLRKYSHPDVESRKDTGCFPIWDGMRVCQGEGQGEGGKIRKKSKKLFPDFMGGS